MLWWCHCQVASAFWASVTDGRWRHAMSTDRQRTCQSVHRVVSSVRSSATRLCVSAGASTLLVERCLARGAWSHRSCPARRSTIPVSDKLTTACNVLLSLPLLAILRTSTHWRQSQIWHDRLCRSPPCQIRLCRKSTKSTVSLWPCTHWRQRNSTRSTLSKSTMSNYTLTQVNKVDRVALAPYTLATKSNGRSTFRQHSGDKNHPIYKFDRVEHVQLWRQSSFDKSATKSLCPQGKGN